MKLEAWQTQIRPVLTRLAVAPVESERVTKGGIVLPEGSYQGGELEIGRVFAVGPGERLQDGQRTGVDAEPGDLVAFIRVGKIQDMVWDGHKFWLLDERDLLTRITEVADE